LLISLKLTVELTWTQLSLKHNLYHFDNSTSAGSVAMTSQNILHWNFVDKSNERSAVLLQLVNTYEEPDIESMENAMSNCSADILALQIPSLEAEFGSHSWTWINITTEVSASRIPVSVDQMKMAVIEDISQPHLLVLGGKNCITGEHNREMYGFNLNHFNWTVVEQEGRPETTLEADIDAIHVKNNKLFIRYKQSPSLFV
jgi:hypothetical protein